MSVWGSAMRQVQEYSYPDIQKQGNLGPVTLPCQDYFLIRKKGVTIPPEEPAFGMKRDNADQGMKLDWCLPSGHFYY